MTSTWPLSFLLMTSIASPHVCAYQGSQYIINIAIILTVMAGIWFTVRRNDHFCITGVIFIEKTLKIMMMCHLLGSVPTEFPSYGSICKLLSKSCNSLQLLFLPVKTSRWVSMFGLNHLTCKRFQNAQVGYILTYIMWWNKTWTSVWFMLTTDLIPGLQETENPFRKTNDFETRQNAHSFLDFRTPECRALYQLRCKENR